ncbi:MAG: AhpC/TSA family protein, partial [Bacteroidales bacterium]|nr:AhpC/TSA family protein [Bacteroidales bacterium]
ENNMRQWKNVIKSDNLNWITTSDLKGLDSEILQLYGIRKLPYYFFLNKNGIIITSGDDLNVLIPEIDFFF